MKKIKLVSMGLLALTFSGVTAAAPIALSSGGTDITMLQCTQLANDIDLVLTQNVIGALDCDDATIVGLSVCHTTGLTTERTGSSAPVSGACVAPMTLNADQTLCVGTVAGSVYPSATTAQGTVSSRFPGNACTAANVAVEATAAVTDALAAQ